MYSSVMQSVNGAFFQEEHSTTISFSLTQMAYMTLGWTSAAALPPKHTQNNYCKLLIRPDELVICALSYITLLALQVTHILQNTNNTSKVHHTLGVSGPVGPTMQSMATVSDRCRAAHHKLVKQGALHEDNRTGQHKRTHVEKNEAAGSTSATWPEGDELGENNINDDDFNGHQDCDKPKLPMPQPDTNHRENEPLPNAPSRPPSPPDPAPSRSSSPPNPAWDNDVEPPQQNIDQRMCINVDINELEHLAVLPKQKDAIAFIWALQHATLDDLCTKLNEAALHHL
ncbi:hypothetical protein EDD22DRAFT_849240 [Suillus occidentalis]|nr:hypothetical protein EDD22DRAFT_849240 [Suillus occidentalis]